MEDGELTYATIFSGIGGWEIGLNRCNWKLRWQCESDPFCQHILRSRFGVPLCPDARFLFKWLQEVFGSIKGGAIDVLVGSPPCQPHSTAGKQLGITDPRYLFPIFASAARKLQPKILLMEQVAAILSDEEAFGKYLGKLAEIGYDAVWHCIPASAIGAPHRRDRIWIIAANTAFHGWSRTICSDVANEPETCWPKPAKQAGSLDSRLAIFQAIEQSLGEPAGFSRFDGDTTRLECELAAIGNAVVPQIPFMIGTAINSVFSPASTPATAMDAGGRQSQN